MSRNLALRSLFFRLFGRIIGAGILALKIILSICWKSSFKYLAIEDIVDNVIKNSKLGAEQKIEGFSSSYISLSIGKWV